MDYVYVISESINCCVQIALVWVVLETQVVSSELKGSHAQTRRAYFMFLA